jgi:hypothetical protein
VRVRFAVVVLFVVMAAVGCSGSSSPEPSPTASSPSASESVSPTPSAASPTTSTTSTPTPTSSAPAAAAACATSALRLHVGSGGAAAGTYYFALVVTNVSSAPCSLFGYPGVSFLDAAGNQLGLPAQRDKSAKPHRLTVQPGGKAHTVVGIPSPDNFGSGCGEAHARAVRLYPPDQTAPLHAKVDVTVCTDRNGRTSVRSMTSGTGD